MTKKQLEIMDKLEKGFAWEWHIHHEEDDVLRYLMEQGICRSREDIRSGWLELTQKGLVLLDAHRNQCTQAHQEEADQKAKETLRIKERSEDMATEERRHQEQKSTQIKAAFLSAGLSFVAGVFAEHFLQVVEIFRKILSQ